MRSFRRQWLTVGVLTIMTMALTGAATVGLAPTSLAAAASAGPATSPVAAPGISAPANLVVGAADGSVQLNVTLNAPGVNPVTVNYTTANGTTSSNSFCNGTDYGYVGQSGTLTFAPGTTSQPVTVPLLNCGNSLGLGFQEFTLNLSGNSSDSSIVRASTQIDITGDAPAASTPGLSVLGAVVDNSAGTIEVPVVLGGPSGASTSVAVTVPYSTHNGSAVAGTDYTSTSGTLTFPPGETAQNITVPILARSGSAPARSFTVTLGTPTNATVAQRTGVVTIGASGAKAAASPGISAPANEVIGAADGYVDLPVTLNAPGVNPVTVNYTTANGTSSSNSFCNGTGYGYVGYSGSLTFEPGVTTEVVRVPLLNCGNSLGLGFQEFTLNLSGNSSDSSIVRASTQIDITGDAPAASTPGLSVLGAVVDNSAGTIEVPVVLGGPSGASTSVAVTVPYSTHNGSAVAGTDYTSTSGTLTFPPGETAQNITVPILARTGSAPARSFTVTLGTPTNATVAQRTGVVTIGASGAKAAASPGISAPANEVIGAADGYVDLPVTLNAPGVNPVTVSYTTANGTSSSNSFCNGTGYGYFGQAGSLTFEPGVTTEVVRVPLLNCGNSLGLGFQEFTLNLSGNSSDSSIVRASTQIDITGDAPAASTPGLSVLGAVVDNSAGTIEVPVVLGGPSGASTSVAVTVPYSTHNGSAVAGTDYTSTSGTLTFPPGETAQNITVPILARTGSAPARSFTVTLGTPTNATVAQRTGVVTIGASGAKAAASPGISAPANEVIGAADGYVDLPVTLNAPGVNPVTVSYTTANGTSSSNSFCNGTGYGYFGQAGSLTFEPGVTTEVVRVPLLNCGNSLGLGFQEFTLNLSGNSSDSSIVRASTQIDITGDAPAASTPGLSVLGAVVDNSAGTIEVPVVLGGPSGASTSVAVTVPYSTHNGSAVAGTDYTSTSGTLTFPPGETAQNITVPILARTGSAPARSFTVTLGTPTNATVAQRTGVVTIGASGAKAAAPKISASPNTTVSRAAGYVDLPVTLKAPGVNPVTVNYTTANGTSSSNSFCNGTGYGYVGYSGSLTFEPGVTTEVVRVPLLNCGQTAKATFFLDLSDNSSDSTIARAKTTITVVPKVSNPGAPRTVTAVGGNGTATVDFDAPVSDGGSAIYSYTVTASPGGATASGISSPITVSGLTNGTAYTLTVTATNNHGTGPASLPSNSVTPS